ncbi:MAG: SIMPL domain-containing protein [bacterium]
MITKNENTKSWLAPVILAAGLLLSSLIFSLFFYASRATGDVLTVTGSAKVAVKADKVKWQTSFSRIVSPSNIKDGYTQMDKDLVVMKAFFKNNGIDEKKLEISPILMNENYDYQKTANQRDFTLRQNIILNSTDVDKITAVAKNTKSIVEKGVIFNPNQPEYYFSDLPKVRVELQSSAVKDALVRAESLVGETGRKVGGLKTASAGVVQVMPENSLDVSDYGSYDTSTIKKEVTMTVRATFNLK